MAAAKPLNPDASVSDSDAARASLGAVVDALPCGLVTFDRHLRIRTANIAARAMTGDDSDAAALLQRICADGPCVDWQSELRDVWQRRMTRRYEAVSANGSIVDARYYDIVIRPAGNAASPEMVGVILIDDVTARITMQRRLAITDRMASIGKVAARVAHELNNPLDGILRYANLAGRRIDDGGGEKVRDYLERIREGAIRMSSIVRDLLAFSRSHADVDREATLCGLVDDAIEAMSAAAQEQGVSLRHVRGETDSRVQRGSGLFQVFCNLIKNAIDAMDGGGTLTIATNANAHGMMAVFDDTGPGVPDVERIFEAFYTTKAEGKGTGLGLAVCREIVESIGGTIGAANRAEGGARFTVRLPRLDKGDTDGAGY